jgi:peptide/nickel transport system ATP-binding protein/oligopeptide transport system ATP-binding protein
MYFPVRRGFFARKVADVKAVDGVSFVIPEGKTFGLVGESGCGKTTTGKCILRIYNPTSGEIRYRGRNIAHASKMQITPFRREIQLIFQDPYSSLDPRQSVWMILREAITEDHERHTTDEIKARVDELLCTVELDPSMKDRYPHEMSGGQRQRLGIARALACNPKLIVCDEPVSALDVSIQAQIINLMKKLQKEYGLTYLFVAHDLAVVRHIADEIGVMYLGRIVEKMDAAELYSHPLHPYTKALMSAVPITDYYEERKRHRIILEGEVPSPIHAPPGCPFHPRCRFATDICRSAMPQMQQVGEKHVVACHNWTVATAK